MWVKRRGNLGIDPHLLVLPPVNRLVVRLDVINKPTFGGNSTFQKKRKGKERKGGSWHYRDLSGGEGGILEVLVVNLCSQHVSSCIRERTLHME
jgi:hypothetical protein